MGALVVVEGEEGGGVCVCAWWRSAIHLWSTPRAGWVGGGEGGCGDLGEARRGGGGGFLSRACTTKASPCFSPRRCRGVGSKVDKGGPTSGGSPGERRWILEVDSKSVPTPGHLLDISANKSATLVPAWKEIAVGLTWLWSGN